MLHSLLVVHVACRLPVRRGRGRVTGPGIHIVDGDLTLPLKRRAFQKPTAAGHYQLALVGSREACHKMAAQLKAGPDAVGPELPPPAAPVMPASTDTTPPVTEPVTDSTPVAPVSTDGGEPAVEPETPAVVEPTETPVAPETDQPA